MWILFEEMLLLVASRGLIEPGRGKHPSNVDLWPRRSIFRLDCVPQKTVYILFAAL